jgi:hypothetical protein
VPFTNFPLFANPFDNPAAIVERHLRLRQLESQEQDERDFPEAELDDSIRRAAMARERLRRLGMR